LRTTKISRVANSPPAQNLLGNKGEKNEKLRGKKTQKPLKSDKSS
jgi:hypothetical protein